MKSLRTCCRCRLTLIATAITAWIISLIADVAAWSGFANNASGQIALWGIVLGIGAMLAGALSCAYDLRFQDEPAAKAELLDAGIMFAAALLFIINAVLRQTIASESALPMWLSLLGVSAVVGEFWLDLTESHQTATPETRYEHKS